MRSIQVVIRTVVLYIFDVFGLMYYIRYVNHVRNGKV